MSREILFRGKDIKGNWYEGLLAHNIAKDEWYISNKAGISTAYQVRPETIGQFTGLTDKNGTKIFENDILQVNYHGNEIGRVCIYYKFAMYLCDIIYGDVDFDTLGMLNANYQLEVIGNVYDNPELIEK